ERRRGILERARPVVPAVEVVTGRRGIPRRTVLEFHALPQVEGPRLTAGELPARCQRRNDLRGPGLQPHKPFEDLLRDHERPAVPATSRTANATSGRASLLKFPLTQTPFVVPPFRRTHKYEQKVKPSQPKTLLAQKRLR